MRSALPVIVTRALKEEKVPFEARSSGFKDPKPKQTEQIVSGAAPSCQHPNAMMVMMSSGSRAGAQIANHQPCKFIGALKTSSIDTDEGMGSSTCQSNHNPLIHSARKL